MLAQKAIGAAATRLGKPPVSPVAPPRQMYPGAIAPVGAPKPQMAPPGMNDAPPQTPPVSMVPSSAGSNTSAFGPGNDLLSTQVGPVTPTAQPKDYSSVFGTGQVQGGPAVNPMDSQRFNTLSGQQDQAVGNLTTGPNRTELAKQALSDFEKQGQLDLNGEIRNIGQSAAKFGRIGAGMTTNDLTGAQATYDRNRMAFQNQLAQNVAEGDIADRLNTVNALSGLRGQEQGFGVSNRNEQRGERDYSTGLARDNQSALLDRQKLATDYTNNAQDRLFSQQLSGNNELRGERDYQTGRSDKAQQDAINQRNNEEDLANSAFSRAMQRAQFGYGGSPVDTLGNFSTALGNQAAGATSAGVDLLRKQPPPIDWMSLLNPQATAPGTPHASGVPQVVRNGKPVTIGSL